VSERYYHCRAGQPIKESGSTGGFQYSFAIKRQQQIIMSVALKGWIFKTKKGVVKSDNPFFNI